MTPQAELLESICRRDELQAMLDRAALQVSERLLTLQAQGRTQAELAGLLGVSRQRVGQLLDRAERDMRQQHEEDQGKDAYSRRRKGECRQSGFGPGRVQPRCPSCDHFIATESSRCRRCFPTERAA